jgi:hypothetical protein
MCYNLEVKSSILNVKSKIAAFQKLGGQNNILTYLFIYWFVPK